MNAAQHIRGLLWLLLMFALGRDGYATDYYVDASAGSDANSGRSTSSPWQTVAKVNSRTFGPGDTIKFKAGEVWPERLVVSWSGTSGSPITFTRYGSGPNPVIKSSETISSSDWVHENPPSGHVYSYTTKNADPTWLNPWGAAPAGGRLLSRYWYYGMGDTPYGPPSSITNPDIAELESTMKEDFTWSPLDRGKIFIWSNGNPGEMEIGRRPHCIYMEEVHYITIDGIDLLGPGGGERDNYHNALLFARTSTHVITRNCVVKNNPRRGIHYRDGSSYGIVENCLIEWVWGGVHGYGPTHHMTVRGNTFRYIGSQTVSNGDRGVIASWGHHWLVEHNHIENHCWQGTVDPEGMSHTPDYAVTFCCGALCNPPGESGDQIVRYNTFKNLGGGAIQFAGGDDNEAYYNIVDGWNLQRMYTPNSNCGGGIKIVTWDSSAHPTNTGNRIYNNVLFGGKEIPETEKDAAILIGGTTIDTKIRNNIVFGSEPNVRALYASFHTGTTGNSVENNLFNVPEGEAILWWTGVFYDADHVVSSAGCPNPGYWQCDQASCSAGVVRDNIVADPMFVDAENGNFRLQAGSPAINAGKDVGLSQDLDGRAIDGLPDMGAFEYTAPSPPAAPSALAATARSATEIRLSWTDNSDNETRFKIRRSLDGTDFYTLTPIFAGPGATSVTDNALGPETTYYYKIRSENDAGVSPYIGPADSTTPRATAGMFTAYNDLAWADGQSSANITTCTRQQSGLLTDYLTGTLLPVRLTVNGGRGPYPTTQGAGPAAGTPADRVFGGAVDCLGLITYETTELTLTLEGLDPAVPYELVLFGNRDTTGYEGRTTTVILDGADSFENTSSSGTVIGTTVEPADTTTVGNGNNTAAGHIVRYSQIKSGADGIIAAKVPAWSGTGDAGRYYLNAVMLTSVQHEQPIVKIASGSAWRYRKGTTEASNPATDWRKPGFDDSGWASGHAPFGYDVPDPWPAGTELDMKGNYPSVFLRSSFIIHHSSLINELRLWAQFDDGFILWLNGEELARVNVSGTPGTFVVHDTTCSGYVSGASTIWTKTFEAGAIPVLASNNVLAAQLFNNTLGSGDAMLDLELAVTQRRLSAAEDADQDGLPDAWEDAQLAGLSDPSDSSDQSDPDNDGLSNIDEYIAGSPATNNASCFEVRLDHSAGALTVSFQTREAAGPGYTGLERRYALEARAQLGPNAAWHPVPSYTNILGTGETVCYTNAGPAEPEFYRGKVWLAEP